MDQAELLLESRRGLVRAQVESARPLGTALEARLAQAVKARTGAREVRFEKQLRPELAGGCRLRIGDEVFDASVQGFLREMAADLGKQ
jgi:F-type H+-transporting ATPase subunit delta